MVEYNYEPGFEESGFWDFLHQFPEVTYEDNKVWGWRNGEYIELTQQFERLPNVIRFGVEGPDPEEVARRSKALADEARRVMKERAQAIADHWGIPLVDMSYTRTYNAPDTVSTPSADFTIDLDGSIIHNTTGERIKMATTIRTTEDLSTLTDEQLAEQERAFVAEAKRRQAEVERRKREAKPNFMKFMFDAQYPNYNDFRSVRLADNMGSGLRKYTFIGMITDDGRVYITGRELGDNRNTFESWADFENYARRNYYWMSAVRKLKADTEVATFEVKRTA